jgi:glycosyltransferase involved in cell wall biosynthesis
VRQVLPQILRRIPNAFVSVVGKVIDRLQRELSLNPAVRLYGQVSNERIAEVLDQHRVFIAPTRFASGIPHKCHTAASSGVPIVCTELLAQQLDWIEGQVLAVPVDTAAFAQACIRLHSDRELWQQTQLAAFQAVTKDCSAQQMYNFRDWLLSQSEAAL